MDKFDRIYALHTLLTQSRTTVSMEKIRQELECSVSTAERIIREMRDYLRAPIQYDRELNSYSYIKSAGTYELPGLWFNAAELHALLFTHQLLESLDPGMLESHIAPLKEKIESLLSSQNLEKKNIAKRFRFIKIAGREVDSKIFSMVADALVNRKTMSIQYCGLESHQPTQRDISPQRLLYYRDNWYLDAWCHLREELRSFALERVQHCALTNTNALEINETELDKHFTRSYGIFSGEPTNTAVIRFTGMPTRWVSKEQWHPEQKGYRHQDGSYELHIPYHDPRELIMDILKYGEHAEVIEPDDLRKQLVDKLTNALKNYKVH